MAGQGPIGLMFTRLFRLQDVRIIATDLMESRLKLARKFGARWVAHPRELTTPTKDAASSALGTVLRRGIDAAVLAVPANEALTQAFSLVRGAGQILLFAHTRRGARADVDLSSVCVDEKDLIGSYSADFRLQREVAELVFSRRLDVRRLITHRFSLEHAIEAVHLANHPTAESLKVVICP